MVDCKRGQIADDDVRVRHLRSPRDEGRRPRSGEGEDDARYQPAVLLELACHLDEAIDGEDAATAFRRRKGHLLKCAIFDLLDDPFAERAVLVGAGELVNTSRFYDRVVIPQVLDALGESQTADEFYGRTVTYPNGDTRVLRGLADGARTVLAEPEQEFEAHVRHLARTLLGKFGLARVSDISDRAFLAVVFARCLELVARYRGDGIEREAL